MSKEQHTKLYETRHYKPYAELGKEHEKEWGSWGNVLVTIEDRRREWMSFYSDPRITKRLFTDPIIEHAGQQKKNKLTIADFGGGDGIMLHHITSQLTESGFNICPLLIDIDGQKLHSAQQQYPELHTIESDVTRSGLRDGSIDVIVSRNTIQYLALGKQREEWDQQIELFLKEISVKLHNKGLCVLVCAGVGQEPEKTANLNAFWNGITAIRLGKNQDQYYPNTKIIEKFGKNVGLHTPSNTPVNWIDFGITAESVIDRFQITDTKIKLKLKNHFKSAKSTSSSTLWRGQVVIHVPITQIIFKKLKQAYTL